MNFDVFLCHNSQDKPEVIEVGLKLQGQGLKPWLDEWELQPGLPWQRELERQIQNIKSAAVFVGGSGVGPWQQMEIEAYLRRFVNQGCPVIPVLLPNAPQQPELPLFLEGMTWVDFRRSRPEPMGRLIWGITGIKQLKSPELKLIWVLELRANLDEVDGQKLEAILNYLHEISEDTSLTLKQTVSGSIKLIVEGSQQGMERIKALFESGELTEILGIPIQGISLPELDKLERTESPPYQPEEIELKSGKGIDYSNLEKLLAEGKWKEADQETAKVMCQAAGREKESWLNKESIDDFPCEDLRTINQLWLRYSNNKFGFSIQKEIYERLGGKKECNQEVWKKFCDEVGWRKEGSWLSYSDFTFDLLKAPPAHLPVPLKDGASKPRFLVGNNLMGRWYCLLSRKDL